MKKLMTLMVVGLIGFTFSQCTQPKESDNTTAEFKEEMREDREQLAENLRELRDDIDRKLDKVSKDLRMHQKMLKKN
ncbi:MAG: hypothetical protein WAU36_12955 [Cyclobacteriaceae bacterium]